MSISEAGFFNLLRSLKQFRNLLESALEMKNGCCCSQPVWLEYIKLTLVTAGVGGSSTHPTWGSYESWNRFEGSHEGDYHAGFLFSSWDNFTSLHKIHFWPMDTRNGFFCCCNQQKEMYFHTHFSDTPAICLSLAHPPLPGGCIHLPITRAPRRANRCLKHLYNLRMNLLGACQDKIQPAPAARAIGISGR